MSNPTFKHLRVLVAVLLEKQGVTHAQAAKRAGITGASWSVAIRDGDPSPERIERIASGLGMTSAEFIVALDSVRKEIGQWTP